jgi:signal transduction histidine kinase
VTEPTRPGRPGGLGRLSLRLRVTLVAALVTAAGLIAVSILLVLSLRSGLIGGLDDAAQSRATQVAAAVRGGQALGAGSVPDDSTAVQVVDVRGKVVQSSPGLVGRAPLVHPPVPAGFHQADNARIAGSDYRVLTLSEGGLTIVLASSLKDVEESTARLTTSLALGVPLLLALISGAVWLLLGYTLRTIERLRRQVAQLTATGLDQRLGIPPARDEVRRLAETMNDLLDRLERALHAQRRFVADAAHELRSPIAALRARLEVTAAAADPEGWQFHAASMINDADRLTRLVDDLLALARLDESPGPRHARAVDLDDIVFAEVARRRAAGTASGIVSIVTAEVSAGLVEGDPELLRRVVRNLLDNAVRHAHSQVRVGVSTSDGRVELVVLDDGPGIPGQLRSRVFERFLRLDDARGRDDGGSGLGLAIVREAVLAHGGSVTVEDARPGARFVVWFPENRSLRDS